MGSAANLLQADHFRKPLASMRLCSKPEATRTCQESASLSMRLAEIILRKIIWGGKTSVASHWPCKLSRMVSPGRSPASW